MAYITNADIESFLGTGTLVQLTDDAGTGTVDTTKVDAARAAAEGAADSYLATRYRVPVDVSSEPDAAAALRGFVLDLAAYRLHSRKPPVPADVLRRNAEAVQWFKLLALGQVQLPAATKVKPNPALGLHAKATGAPRVMTRQSLEDV